MGSKISQYPERSILTGEEEAIVALEGSNYKFKLKRIRNLITKEDVGLGEVNNTSDEDKPVGLATRQALEGKANTNHEHQLSDVTGLVTALEGKAPTVHEHAIEDVDGLGDALQGKAAINHEHAIEDVEGLEQILIDKANAIHTHSMNAVDGLVDSLNEITDAVNDKADAVHTHVPSSVVGLETYVNDLIAVATESFVKVGELQW